MGAHSVNQFCKYRINRDCVEAGAIKDGVRGWCCRVNRLRRGPPTRTEADDAGQHDVPELLVELEESGVHGEVVGLAHWCVHLSLVWDIDMMRPRYASDSGDHGLGFLLLVDGGMGGLNRGGYVLPLGGPDSSIL
ncbi:unnamed protein product [Clonostachys rhizophaga]|uniref:Uncharacterized protein n=1 Tax=Clonostachys rhizophaga TaxID=160324 RepID=A0A9N9V0G1_9HYPO|nr:unnamed protein product [Clonostachys rhizophaga]